MPEIVVQLKVFFMCFSVDKKISIEVSRGNDADLVGIYDIEISVDNNLIIGTQEKKGRN